jgi:mannitol/fructose-specific phosphotransferase system IIA component (Ntr-type)
MKLMDFVVPEAVIPDLEATDRDGVIRELVAALTKAGAINEKDQDSICQAVIARERQGSTGFGKGVAVPHEKHPAAKSMVAAVGRSSKGVDFAALDRAPVYSILLLLSPPDKPDQHLQAMESIFRHLQRDTFRRFLRQSETTEAILDLLSEADEMPTT